MTEWNNAKLNTVSVYDFAPVCAILADITVSDVDVQYLMGYPPSNAAIWFGPPMRPVFRVRRKPHCMTWARAGR